MNNMPVINEDNCNLFKTKDTNVFPDSINSFLNRSNISSEYKRKVKRVLTDFLKVYDAQKMEIKILSLDHFNSYKTSLEIKMSRNTIKLVSAQSDLKVINSLSKHLFRNNQISFIFNGTFIEKSTKKNKSFPPVIHSFLEDLTLKNYSQINTYKKNIMYFLKFLSQEYKEFKIPGSLQENDIKELNKDHIESYHTFLARRIALNEISPSRALNLLRCLNLFIQFYRRLQFISFRYCVPDKFQIQHVRSNEYVPSKETLKLIDAIIDYSTMPERNLSIFLIILDTGCRPLEITNIEIQDVLKSESAVILRSKKSGQRKLKLSSLVMKVLRKYLQIRESLDYKGKTLFLSSRNQPLTVNVVGQIYASANKKVYGEIRYTAKSFRHAFATNALEKKNNFDSVSKTLGHLHWISTQYYLEKSLERLKRNSLPHNPVAYLKEEN
ncbi:tyrosine-type recombinase/integrase [Bacillus sp. EB106-08-02-XG196]|uniref:tyrosine-type recombinase/integrase n=1 Tax=Bacillus sp. EB106-08-02-XG196 TaxID=2737049 RepID=UPI0015C4C8B6|nr:tyrosine-type recombinase/integrase [Bacillus sp. EB106-08-02-XG196]NWQ40351.1 tyrosine-type recombinase/integrase [Bacillus sp. EB106-08-02-XG196]